MKLSTILTTTYSLIAVSGAIALFCMCLADLKTISTPKPTRPILAQLNQ